MRVGLMLIYLPKAVANRHHLALRSPIFTWRGKTSTIRPKGDKFAEDALIFHGSGIAARRERALIAGWRKSGVRCLGGKLPRSF